MKQLFTPLFCLLVFLIYSGTSSIYADNVTLSDLDMNAPMGWATCSSLSGGTFKLTGGSNGGKSITLQSDGANDMRSTIGNAIKNNDVIIFDGGGSKGTDFIVSSNIDLSSLSNKTLVGINGARLCTKWYVTPELTALLDAAGVKEASTLSGTGGTLNGTKIDEEAEYLTRKIIYETYGDKSEAYRKSGIFTVSGCNNIIIRNLKFVGPGSIDVGGYDLISSINKTKNLWVDHCDFTDGIDGNFDITQQSDLVSVTWCTFSYTERSYMHQNTNLVGGSDSNTADENKLNITFAYNIWGTGCRARMPMARFGTLHMLNNYYNCAGNLTPCINPRKNSEFLIEGNYFDSSISQVFSASDAKGYVWADDNYIGDINVEKPQSTYTSLKMPYSYVVQNAQVLPEQLTGACGAGATLTNPLVVGRDDLPQPTVPATDSMTVVLQGISGLPMAPEDWSEVAVGCDVTKGAYFDAMGFNMTTNANYVSVDVSAYSDFYIHSVSFSVTIPGMTSAKNTYIYIIGENQVTGQVGGKEAESVVVTTAGTDRPTFFKIQRSAGSRTVISNLVFALAKNETEGIEEVEREFASQKMLRLNGQQAAGSKGLFICGGRLIFVK